jgi:hypothetical protein
MSDYYSTAERALPLFAARMAPSVNGSATSAAAADALKPTVLNECSAVFGGSLTRAARSAPLTRKCRRRWG